MNNTTKAELGQDVTLTGELLHSLATGNNKAGWTRAQLKILGVKWPPKKGWLTRKIGDKITELQLAELQRLQQQRIAYNNRGLNLWDGFPDVNAGTMQSTKPVRS